MAAATLATTLKNQILDKVLRNTDFTPGTVYISLHTADPGTTGASEVVVGASSYVRKAYGASAAAAGNIENSASLDFTNMPACTVTHFGVWNNATPGSGTFYLGAALTASKTVNVGDTFQFTAGACDVSIS